MSESAARSDVYVVDVDSHVYEPEDIWSRYVDPAYGPLARSAFWHGWDRGGNVTTILNGAPARGLSRSKIIRQGIWRPGMLPSDVGALQPGVFHELNPGAFDAVARLEDMDAMGIAEAVVLPTLFAEYFPLIENPDAARVLASAYNDWVADFCETGRGRLHPVAILPLQSMMFSQAELSRIAERGGFVGVLLRPMVYTGCGQEGRGVQTPLQRHLRQAREYVGALPHPDDGIFIDNAHFMPLWEQIEAFGLVACIHGAAGIAAPEGTSAGSFIERVSSKLDIGHSVAESVAYLQDVSVFLTAVACHGLMEDLPSLRIALLHAGASCAPLALEKAETYLWLNIGHVTGMVGNGPVSLEPAEVFSEHPVLSSFDSWETTVARTPDHYRDKAAWGSRYPHHDASSPEEAVGMLEAHGVEAACVRKLMGGNAIDLFRLTGPALASRMQSTSAEL